MNNDLTAMKYFGGKSRYQIRAWLNGLIPHNPRGLYCEPFAGMLGLLLSRPIAKQEVVNDLESHIINFWRVIGDEDKYKRLERQTRYTHHSQRTVLAGRKHHRRQDTGRRRANSMGGLCHATSRRRPRH